MRTLEKIKVLLESEGLEIEIGTGELGLKELRWERFNCIFEGNSALDINNLAWYQYDGSDLGFIRIIQNGVSVSWIPKTSNCGDLCIPILIEWISNSLVFIYQEEHGIYVASINNGVVKDFYIHGCQLARQQRVLAYETFTKKMEGYVRMIELPSLNAIKPITIDEARSRGLFPEDWDNSYEGSL